MFGWSDDWTALWARVQGQQTTNDGAVSSVQNWLVFFIVQTIDFVCICEWVSECAHVAFWLCWWMLIILLHRRLAVSDLQRVAIQTHTQNTNNDAKLIIWKRLRLGNNRANGSFITFNLCPENLRASQNLIKALSATLRSNCYLMPTMCRSVTVDND